MQNPKNLNPPVHLQWGLNGLNCLNSVKNPDIRKETDSLGGVDVPADRLRGAQTQRSLAHFSIGEDLIPREMITAYAILKKAAAAANHAGKRLPHQQYNLIVQTCDEILAGQHHDMFPLHVWMTGSGTQFNMNVNEVISNRCCQLAGTPLGRRGLLRIGRRRQRCVRLHVASGLPRRLSEKPAAVYADRVSQKEDGLGGMEMM